MKSIKNLQNKTNPLIKGAWVTLGIPFDLPMVIEKNEGIIDVEALIMTTLLMMEHDRILTDLPAWINRFSSLINHQKLKTMFKTMSGEKRDVVLENLNQDLFRSIPKSFQSVFSLKELSPSSISENVNMRLQKLNTIEHVAQTSCMIHHRLLYGTGFRADLITLTNIEGLRMKGTQLAELLCTNNSTISRILNDLKACRFLDEDNERIGQIESYPGMFISTQSLWNLCDMIDAYRFSFEELKRDVFENLNLKYDVFSRKIITKLV